MGFSRFSEERLLPILINRMVLFFFVMGILTLFLYAAGTVQEFTDSTQFTLLAIYSVLGIFLTVTAISGIVLDLGRFISTKKGRYFLRAGGYLLLVVFGAVTVLAVMAILALSGGEGLN
jgi:hypothetical protein